MEAGRLTLWKPILDITFGADTAILSSSAIWNLRCGKKRKIPYLIFTRVIHKMKQKWAALVLARCLPCWCVRSILNISLQVVEWEQKAETRRLNLAADWIALTKTFASLPVPFFLSAQAAGHLITEGSLLANSISWREPCVGYWIREMERDITSSQKQPRAAQVGFSPLLGKAHPSLGVGYPDRCGSLGSQTCWGRRTSSLEGRTGLVPASAGHPLLKIAQVLVSWCLWICSICSKHSKYSNTVSMDKGCGLSV